ncbi:hypothetical protein [Sinomonas sp.]|uniref:hypothetical protein n=1 Tax=Sinomonas sp. TaxID=1914986 RepID=UPI003F823794
MDAGLVIIVAAESLLWASAGRPRRVAAVAVTGVALFRALLGAAPVTAALKNRP